MPDTTKNGSSSPYKRRISDGRADVISCALELNNHGFTGMMVSDHNFTKVISLISSRKTSILN